MQLGCCTDSKLTIFSDGACFNVFAAYHCIDAVDLAVNHATQIVSFRLVLFAITILIS